MAQSPFDFSGRVALVTGCGSAEGIGFAAARMLSQLRARVADVCVNAAGSQREIVDLLASGLSTSDIAEKVTLSTETVRNHVLRVFSELQVQHAPRGDRSRSAPRPARPARTRAAVVQLDRRDRVMPAG